jgi:hypothetical protein
MYIATNIYFFSPTTVSIQFVKSCLRSALFLTTYVVIGITVPCLLRRWITRDPRFIYFLNGLAAGTAVLIEAPGRQLGNIKM